jgi:hypothetical protein
MQRAAVLIGVSKTGNLPPLQAVWPSVHDMAQWAESQGIPGKLMEKVTDEKEPVTVDRIKSAIGKLVERTTVDQLIVYFSGHGFNIEGEFWLLSGAPKDSNAAVNVEGSIRLARYCSVGHVILISDACRSAAAGIQALQVKGSDVFPNEPASATEKPVDILYACARGMPSLEVADPAKAVAAAAKQAKQYSALYTEVLLEYLKGEHKEALTPVQEDGKHVGLLQLGDLADCLVREVPLRLTAKKVDPKINQTPTDSIGFRTGKAWLSRIPLSAEDLTRREKAVVQVSKSTLITPFTVADRLVSVSLAGDLGTWKDVLSLDIEGEETALLKSAIATQAAPFGPMHFETRCGFKVRGARIVRTVQRDVGVELLGSEGNVIRVNGAPPEGANVLLVLENGAGVVVPAIPEFIAALRFESGQLRDVSYEPSENSAQWGEYAASAEKLRSLRATIAASTALGVFRLRQQGQLALAKRMQMAKGIDPSLAIYAAYGYDALQRRDLIDEMRGFMAGRLGLTFFDVALLSGSLKAGRVVPAFPMLSQGWALLSAYRAELPPALQGIEQRRVPSLWTLFDPTAVAMLEAAILSGEMR